MMELLTPDQQEFDACKADAAQRTRVTTFDFLKAGIITRPALALLPRRNYNYLVRTDASNCPIGATLRLLQILVEGTGTGQGTESQNRIIANLPRNCMIPRLATAVMTKSCMVSVMPWSIENTPQSGHKFRVPTQHCSCHGATIPH